MSARRANVRALLRRAWHRRRRPPPLCRAIVQEGSPSLRRRGSRTRRDRNGQTNRGGRSRRAQPSSPRVARTIPGNKAAAHDHRPKEEAAEVLEGSYRGAMKSGQVCRGLSLTAPSFCSSERARAPESTQSGRGRGRHPALAARSSEESRKNASFPCPKGDRRGLAGTGLNTRIASGGGRGWARFPCPWPPFGLNTVIAGCRRAPSWARSLVSGSG